MAAYYNEFDPFAAQWLRNLISAGLIAPGDVDTRSIKEVKPDDLRGYTQCHFFAGIGGWSLALRRAGWADERPVWTGSCPCQPFSTAGRQKGKGDERHLWPSWKELIKKCKPETIFGEQVASSEIVGTELEVSFTNAVQRGDCAAANKFANRLAKTPGFGFADRWLDDVSDDLEAEGYSCGAAVLPACSVGKAHKRDRLWFVADSECSAAARRVNSPTRRGGGVHKGGEVSEEWGSASGVLRNSGCGDSIMADTGHYESGGRDTVRSAATKHAEEEGSGQRTSSEGRNEAWLGTFDEFTDGRARGGGDVGDAQHAGWDASTLSGSEGQTVQHDTQGQNCASQPQGTSTPRNVADPECFGRQGSGSVGEPLHPTAGSGREADKPLHDSARHDGWGNLEWVACPDGKTRPIEPSIRLLVDGFPNRVGALRGFGNAIVPEVAAQFITAYLEARYGRA